MSKETLKTLRIFIPGLFILVGAIPLFSTLQAITSFFQLLSIYIDTLVYAAIITGLGALYHVANLRGVFFKPEVEKIQNNIKMKLLEPFKSDELISKETIKLQSDRALMQVFYALVDNDASLKEKALSVHLNGLIWSSFADLAVISIIYFFSYTALGVFLNDTGFIVVAMISIATHAFSLFIALPRVTKMHLDQSNEQLDYIQTHLTEKLHTLILEEINSKGRK